MVSIGKRIVLLICVLGTMWLLVGCAWTGEQFKNNDTSEVMDTGAWESGTSYFNDYKIDITGPKVGSPSPGTLWSTYYETGDTTVYVDFYGKEGSLEKRIEELEKEGHVIQKGVLWGNACRFYIDEATIAMIPMGEDGYLQVEFTYEGDDLVEMTRVSDGFTLTIEKE